MSCDSFSVGQKKPRGDSPGSGSVHMKCQCSMDIESVPCGLNWIGMRLRKKGSSEQVFLASWSHEGARHGGEACGDLDGESSHNFVTGEHDRVGRDTGPSLPSCEEVEETREALLSRMVEKELRSRTARTPNRFQQHKGALQHVCGANC